MHVRSLDVSWHSEFGYGALRLWDTGTNWRHLEPKKGEWHWERLDAYVQRATTQGLDVLMTLGQAPDWATQGNNDGAPSPSYNPQVPSNMQDWRDYVTALGERYKGRIHEWEIWNEPNLRMFWTGTPQQMAELTHEAALILKRIDPNNHVVSPSVTGEHGVAYLNELLAAGIAQDIDVLGVHLYVESQEPEAMVALAGAYRQVMVNYGLGDLPLWNTEATWHQFVDTRTATLVKEGVMGADQAANYLTRFYLANLAAGVERAYFYGVDYPWSALPLVNRENTSHVLPAGRAMSTIVDNLLGSRFVAFDQTSPDGYTLALAGTGRQLRQLSWNSDEAMNKPRVPADGS